MQRQRTMLQAGLRDGEVFFFNLLFICSIFFGFKYEQKKHSPSKVFILGNHSLN